MAGWVEKLKERAGQLKGEIYVLYLAYRHPATPWYAKILAALVVGYAFSPIDLIPDFIPVLGYLDDLVLVPLGIALVLKMIPEEAMIAARAQAEEEGGHHKPRHWVVAIIIILIWLVLLALIVIWTFRLIRKF
jgi:uncharacterized membrane protein YkvA (DUF1232 family)